MDLRQLEYFVAVAEEANFTRAAERVHISQSGVSAQIRALERELGAALFDRSSRAAVLTVAGEAALPPARAALAGAAAVRDAVDGVNSLVRGRLVVGMVTACTVTPLFDALAAFHQAHPGVQVSLVEDVSDALVDAVRAGSIDLALVGRASSAPEDLPGAVIVSERLVAGVPAGHPLARRSRPRLRDVCAHPVVCLPAGTGIRSVFDDACRARGLRADVALEATAPDAVVDLAARGLGLAILSESIATGADGRLRAVVIEDVPTPAVLALVWRASMSPALRELVAQGCRSFELGPVAA
jgi:DNA-binding transcriptional LysR family regulator